MIAPGVVNLGADYNSFIISRAHTQQLENNFLSALNDIKIQDLWAAACFLQPGLRLLCFCFHMNVTMVGRSGEHLVLSSVSKIGNTYESMEYISKSKIVASIIFAQSARDCLELKHFGFFLRASQKTWPQIKQQILKRRTVQNRQTATS